MVFTLIMTKPQLAEILKPELECPKCQGKLVATDFHNFKIEVCETCAGVWLDAEEFASITHDEPNGSWFGKLFS